MTVEEIRSLIEDIETGRWPKGTVTDGEKRRYLTHFAEMLKCQAHEDECREAAEALLKERNTRRSGAARVAALSPAVSIATRSSDQLSGRQS